MVQIGGWRLHGRDSEPRDASPLILIHGFGSSLQTWDRWTTQLDREHRVNRFDLPVSGLSLPDPSSDYTDARSIEIVIALMDHIGLKRASIGGHAIGGRLAWAFAALHPKRGQLLALVAPDGYARRPSR